MENKIVLEVGVSDGYDTEKLIKKFNLPLYGFEPVPHLFDTLNTKFKNNPNVHIIQAAVDIEEGIRDFNVSNPNGKFTDGTNRSIHPYGCSSLHEFADDIHEKWPGRPDFNVVEKIKVKTINLEKFLDENNFDGEIVYLHCDAQGNDLNVLRSLGKYLRRVKEGVIEVAAKTQLYKGTDNTVEKALEFFKDSGFRIMPPEKNRHEANVYFERID